MREADAPPSTAQGIADRVLRHMGRTGFQPSLVVIGAMDGISFDDFCGYIVAYRWSGLFVEPVPEQFRRLQENYASLGYTPDNRYENSAIAEHDGTVRMLTIRQQAIDEGVVHPCFGGMSAIDPPRNGLASAGDAATVAAYGERIEVSCITLDTLLRRHAVEHIDVLAIDAEGWDHRILRQLDWSRYRPKLVRCEWINMTEEEQAATLAMLRQHRYVIEIAGQNLDAAPAEYFDELEVPEDDEAPPAVVVAAPAPASSRLVPVTLVTALFDLSFEETDTMLRRGYGTFLDHAKRLLCLDWPLVVFAPPALDQLIARFRRPSNTFVVHKTVADLEAFPFYERVQQLRASSAEEVAAPPHVRLRLFHPFAFSKQFFLNDAAIYDPFHSTSFVWMDGDIAAALGDLSELLTEECRRNLAALMADERMLYLCSPPDAVAESPGFTAANLRELAGREPRQRVCGRVFGGSAAVIHALNGIYYGCLAQSLEAGSLGSEEHVLTIVAEKARHLCNLQRLPGGRLRPFFERLQHGVPEREEAASLVSP